MHLLDGLNWRYATKRMNGQKVSPDKLHNILEAIRLAPSSYGLQPYRVVVVEDLGLRQKISASACPQPQVMECSHLLIFASLLHPDVSAGRQYIARIAKTRGLQVDELPLKDFAKILEDYLIQRPTEQLAGWAARQAYIGLGCGLAAAAMEGVDASPMEGFDIKKMNEVLDLTSRGLTSCVLMALGYRDETMDALAKAKKVRMCAEEFFLKLPD